jgi:hypothetical protein
MCGDREVPQHRQKGRDDQKKTRHDGYHPTSPEMHPLSPLFNKKFDLEAGRDVYYRALVFCKLLPC